MLVYSFIGMVWTTRFPIYAERLCRSTQDGQSVFNNSHAARPRAPFEGIFFAIGPYIEGQNVARIYG